MNPQNADPVESVDSVNLLGAAVMVGHHESGELELVISPTHPTIPETAADVFYRGEIREV